MSISESPITLDHQAMLEKKLALFKHTLDGLIDLGADELHKKRNSLLKKTTTDDATVTVHPTTEDSDWVSASNSPEECADPENDADQSEPSRSRTVLASVFGESAETLGQDFLMRAEMLLQAAVHLATEDLIQENAALKQAQAFDTIAEGLTLAEREKFRALTSDLDFAADGYDAKLMLLRSQLFPKRMPRPTGIDESTTCDNAEADSYAVSEPRMAAYQQTMDRIYAR